MKIIIEGTSEEIADLVLAVQSRQSEKVISPKLKLPSVTDGLVNEIAEKINSRLDCDN